MSEVTEEKMFKPCARGQHDTCAHENVFDPTSVCICSCHSVEADVMTQAQFEALLDYSCTLPTGTTIGKKWRRRVPYETGRDIVNTWYTGEYIKDVDPTMVGIKWRRVVIR